MLTNPFEEISLKLDTVIQRLQAIESAKHTPNRIPFKVFCDQEKITRPTGYAWADKGLIQLEKIGGRQYVLIDSIKAVTKYQRREDLTNH